MAGIGFISHLTPPSLFSLCRKLEEAFSDNTGQIRLMIGKELENIRGDIVSEAEARREGNEANDDKTKFFNSIIEEREKAMTTMLEDRIGRIEKTLNMDAETRRKRIEDEQKETTKFLSSIMEVAKLETIALKKKHESMTAKTTEHLRELSAEVVSIQQSTSKAEKRIGEITAASVQGVSQALESGLTQHSSEITELREVISAEITARRNASEKLSVVCDGLHETQKSDDATTNELIGAEIAKIYEKIEEVPSMIEVVVKECNKFTLQQCESVQTGLETKLRSLDESVYKLTNHVEEVQRESKELIDHVAEHLDKTDKMVNKIQIAVDENAENVASEIASARMNESNLNKKIDEAVEKEKEERMDSEKELVEEREKKEDVVLHMLQDEIKKAQETAKIDTHNLKLECNSNLAEKYDELLTAARQHDSELYSTVTLDIASSLTVAKGHADSVTNEKNATINAHIEAVRSVLSEQVSGISAGLQEETKARAGIVDKVEADILSERRKTDGEFTKVQIKLNEDAQFAEKERTMLKNMIESRACSAEEKVRRTKILDHIISQQYLLITHTSTINNQTPARSTNSCRGPHATFAHESNLQRRGF